MGCECCKEVNPQDYQKCKIVNNIKYKSYWAPCGEYFERNCNTTPNKKRKKRK